MDDLQFGRLPKKLDARTLQLPAYSAPFVSPPPKEVHWAAKVPHWSAKWNHKLSCCTISAAADQIQVWTENNGHYNDPPDAEVLKAYCAVSGYNPSTTPPPGPGCYMLDVLNYWRSTGIGINKHKITGYMEVPSWSRNDDLIKWSIFQFGGVFMGLNLPKSCIDQYHAKQPWTVIDGPDGIGQWGHAIGLYGYDDAHVWTVTWGAQKMMSWDFLWKYIVEAYTMLTPDWVPIKGFNMAGFETALKIATQGA